MPNIVKSSLLSSFAPIHHGTSTKSFGPLSFKYDPDSNEVIIDRAKFLSALDLPLNHSVLLCEQTHSDKVVVVDETHEGLGAFEESKAMMVADGMITREKEVNLVIKTADCLPVLIYDPVKEVIGAVHSGWQGTIKRITVKALEKMVEVYDSKIEDCCVYVGPSIGPCCYSVKNEEQIKLFRSQYDNLVEREGTVFVDLWNSLEQDVLALGVRSENYQNDRVCTACQNDRFASHRADNPRLTTNLSVIGMVGE